MMQPKKQKMRTNCTNTVFANAKFSDIVSFFFVGSCCLFHVSILCYLQVPLYGGALSIELPRLVWLVRQIKNGPCCHRHCIGTNKDNSITQLMETVGKVLYGCQHFSRG